MEEPSAVSPSLVHRMYEYLLRHHDEDDAWAMAQRLSYIAEDHYGGFFHNG